MAEIETRNEESCKWCGRELAGDGTCLACAFARRVWLLAGVFLLVPLIGVGACVFPASTQHAEIKNLLTLILCIGGPAAGFAFIMSWGHR